MRYADIMRWGEMHHFPYLCIGLEAARPLSGVVLPHGREHYASLRHHRAYLRLTSKRIARWDARIGEHLSTRHEVEQVRTQVDELLSRVETPIQHQTEVEEGVRQ